ncbi:MAG: NAD(P)/FAD-dependent oxidoreductase [Proteobacteria bacterium]|nr:NAD(P)/FAD-dependent oxidoreductase [Pseudomonadota bacterium]
MDDRLEDVIDVVIVGAGFSGLGAGIQLKQAGIEAFVVLEKADRVGGTWRDNTYPGAACDVPSHLYSFSFAPNARWSRAYGGQPEILAYLERCAATFGLAPHLRFGALVESCTWDERTATWTVRVAGGPTYRARALVLGNGALHVPAYPAIPGRTSFAGTSMHSARWDHAYDFSGKRVAVIGTGASTIQLAPQLARQAARLEVFQRTPPWIVPKGDRPIRARERWVFEHVPGAHWLRRTGLYWLFESRVLGFAFAPRINALAEKLVAAHLAREIPDPALRAQLTPAYRLGCKRVLISNDYYPMFRRENVALVTDKIAAIEPTGIRTADGALHEVDAIVYSTGFHVADYLASIAITGKDGVELNATWRAGVRSFLGISVSGFPNLFLLMGPNTGLGHNSMVFMIEAQVRYMVDAVTRMRRERLASIDVHPAVEVAFAEELKRKLVGTVWTSGCDSWYRAPDGEVLLWPGFTFDYWRRTRSIELANYDVRSRGSLGVDDEVVEHPPLRRRAELR